MTLRATALDHAVRTLLYEQKVLITLYSCIFVLERRVQPEVERILHHGAYHARVTLAKRPFVVNCTFVRFDRNLLNLG